MAKFSTETIESLRKNIRDSIPQLSVNCIIFRMYEQKLQVPVVLPFNRNTWVIPGGFVNQSESLEEAATRILFEQTQIEALLLTQFGTFGSVDRYIDYKESKIEDVIIPEDILEWLSQRFVTIGYYSVLSDPDIELKTSPVFQKVKWIDLKGASGLGMDHSILVTEARKVLSRDLLSLPVIQSFMPEEFTIPELQKLYEAILDRPIDRGNFRKRILKSKNLIKTGQLKENSKRRPPVLYRLDTKNYLNSLNQDIKLGF